MARRHGPIKAGADRHMSALETTCDALPRIATPLWKRPLDNEALPEHRIIPIKSASTRWQCSAESSVQARVGSASERRCRPDVSQGDHTPAHGERPNRPVRSRNPCHPQGRHC